MEERERLCWPVEMMNQQNRTCKCHALQELAGRTIVAGNRLPEDFVKSSFAILGLASKYITL